MAWDIGVHYWADKHGIIAREATISENPFIIRILIIREREEDQSATDILRCDNRGDELRSSIDEAHPNDVQFELLRFWQGIWLLILFLAVRSGTICGAQHRRLLYFLVDSRLLNFVSTAFERNRKVTRIPFAVCIDCKLDES